MTGLLRLLDLVRRELGAEDARAEIGGADPADPRLLFAPHRGGFRVVVVFAEPPPEPERLRARLEELLEAFGGVTSGIDVPEARLELSIARRLDAELTALSGRVGAARAFVVDRESPVIWGSSGTRHVEDGVDVVARLMDVLGRAQRAGLDADSLTAIEPEVAERDLGARGLDPWSARFLAREIERCRATGELNGFRHELAAGVALARVREAWAAEPAGRLLLAARQGGFGVLARSFAGSYALVLAFDATYSELHAESALMRALPLIERLVLALPPIEPPDKPGKVVRLRAPR